MSERALEITLFTLRAMANGGMHDHVSQVGEAMPGGCGHVSQVGEAMLAGCGHVSQVGVTMPASRRAVGSTLSTQELTLSYTHSEMDDILLARFKSYIKQEVQA